MQIKEERVCLHHLAETRLYFWPMRRMIWPRMMKFAAMSGVGAIIVVVILRGKVAVSARVPIHRRRLTRGEAMTYCMMKGSLRYTFWLDHSLALQPRISPMPATHAVGRSHQRREWTAWAVCATGGRR